LLLNSQLAVTNQLLVLARLASRLFLIAAFGAGKQDSSKYTKEERYYPHYTDSHYPSPIGPLPGSDGDDFPRLVDELAPGIAAVIDDILVGLEDPV